MWSCRETILKNHDLFMVMDRPFRKGSSECEWEKANNI